MKLFLTLALTCLPLLCIGAPTYTTYFNNTHTYTNATVVGTNFAGRGVFTNGITAGASAFTGEITSTLGTITADASALDSTATWNNAGVTFTGLKMNITDTASAAASLLMDLQVGGSSIFRITKSGVVEALASSGASGYGWAGNANKIFLENSQITFLGAVARAAAISSSSFKLPAANSISWSSDADTRTAADTILLRDGAANTLALRNGTAAQTFNVYNTYTDASNYERAFVKYISNALTIGTEQAGTGSSRNMNLRTAGVDKWQINTAGHLLAFNDNNYDIGAAAATRPRNIHQGGYLLGTQLVSAKTADYPVVAADSKTVFTNEGTTAIRNNTLPGAAAGLTYTFIVQDTDGLTVTAAAGDTIRIAASVSAAAGNITTTTVGNTVTIVAINATEWIATSVVGTWTVN